LEERGARQADSNRSGRCRRPGIDRWGQLTPRFGTKDRDHLFRRTSNRFFDSNNDGHRRFSGAAFKKLDYLQSLGITCVWLLPFFSVRRCETTGYDHSPIYPERPSAVRDARRTSEAFVQAAHDRHIRVPGSSSS